MIKSKNILIILMVLFVNAMMLVPTHAEWVRGTNNKFKYMNNATGQYVVNNWVQDGNGFYYLDANGDTVSGWYLINNKYYYFNSSGLMQTGFLSVDDKTYYLDATSGQMVTGWIQTQNGGVVDYYYFGDNGVMYKGWNKIGDAWFYFLEGKCLVDTFAEINGLWYHFTVNGTMETGWVNNKGKMYYFNASNGSMMKGWIQDNNGYEYYLSEIDGSLIVNSTIQIAGVTCTFDSVGRCVSKDTQGMVNSSQILGYETTNSTYAGVNVGVSPGVGMNAAGITSFQDEYNQRQGIQQGITTGPK